MKKNALRFLLVIAIVSISLSVRAYTVAPDLQSKPINIDSDYQKIDLANDTMTFTGNVIIVQDTLHLQADKVIVNHMKNQENKQIIATGSPVVFQQTLSETKKVDGSADKLVYDVKDNEVTLVGQARLTHGDNTIRSQILHYNIIEQHILAKSNLSERVQTTLVPEQLSELKE